MADYLEIIKTEEYNEIRKIFDENKPSFLSDSHQARDEYDVYQHSVMVNDILNRPDKTIWKPVINDSTGEPETDANTGKPKVAKGSTKVNRVPVPFQEIICKHIR